MSRRFVLCAMAAAFSYIAPSAVLAEQQACETLVAASYFAKPLAADTTADADKPSQRQFSTDFLQALAQTTHLTIKVLAAQEEKALTEVRSGRADLIIGVSPLPEKDPELTYLLPAYTQKNYHLWVRSGEHVTLKKWPELSGLRGLRVLPLQGLIDFDLQVQLLKWPVRTADSLAVAINKIMGGKADYVVAEQQAMQEYVLAHDLVRRFEVLEPAVETQFLYIAMAKDSACNTPALRSILTKGLTQLAQQP
ncbi:MAG: transporter substrate-binding domain-containing protein [Pseudomonas sp.]|nr:transporter substrate-binding domain-containing protein [Pseudomonas sp.]